MTGSGDAHKSLWMIWPRNLTSALERFYPFERAYGNAMYANDRIPTIFGYPICALELAAFLSCSPYARSGMVKLVQLMRLGIASKCSWLARIECGLSRA